MGPTGGDDHMVRTEHDQPPGLGAGSRADQGAPIARWRCLVDGENGRYCYLDPFQGARDAGAWPRPARDVAQPALAAVGATNPSELRNPEPPRRSCGSSWQSRGRHRCRVPRARCAGLPAAIVEPGITRRTRRGSHPTRRLIGVVGLLEHADRVVVSRRFQGSGDIVICPSFRTAGARELGGTDT